MLSTQWVTAEKQKVWDSKRKQVNDYRKAHHNDYPPPSHPLGQWVRWQRKSLRPFVDVKENVNVDALHKNRSGILKKVNAIQEQRIVILKNDGFLFASDETYREKAVIKYSIIDGLFVKRYNSYTEAAEDNGLKEGSLTQFFYKWNANLKHAVLAYNNHIFRHERCVPPYSYDYVLDKKIKERLKTIKPQYKSRVIYMETNGKIDHDDKVYSCFDFIKTFSDQLEKKGLKTHANLRINERINRCLHETLKGNGVLIDDKRYKYCEPQFIPNYFCFRDDKDIP